MPIVYINRRSNKNGRSVSINEKSDSNNKKENALWKTKKKKSFSPSRTRNWKSPAAGVMTASGPEMHGADVLPAACLTRAAHAHTAADR